MKIAAAFLIAPLLAIRVILGLVLATPFIWATLTCWSLGWDKEGDRLDKIATFLSGVDE